jgi:hypothetical protein
MMMTIRQGLTHTSETTIAVSEGGKLEEAYVEHGAHNVDTTFLPDASSHDRGWRRIPTRSFGRWIGPHRGEGPDDSGGA